MASPEILSQTLAAITAIKLEELSNQKSAFEDGKSKVLKAVKDEPDQIKKVEILLSRIETLPAMGKVSDNPTISLENAKQFLDQVHCDPSVSESLIRDWEMKLAKELNVHSLKYEYASLYGRLVNEWLSTSADTTDNDSTDKSAFETIGRKEMHEQREKWEEYVFKPFISDTTAIENYLRALFTSSKLITSAYESLRERTRKFEESLAETTHFDETTLKHIINGLLRSDLVSDEKRVILKDFLNNKIVLAEISDVLNMRMKSLDNWRWDPRGIAVEQRRQLNGRYRFYHDEDLLQSMLIRRIGLLWSVHFKTELKIFCDSEDVWNPSTVPVPKHDQNRREFFLGRRSTFGKSVEEQRANHFNDDIFLEQLAEDVNEQRGGYDDTSVDKADTRKSGQQITQHLLHTLAAEITLKTHLKEEMNVVRTDFAWFGPSLPHSTMFSVLKFFGVSERWISLFQRILESPIKFIEDGSDAPIQYRKRGTPISGPLSDMLGETVLFCLDFAFNQRGTRLYRLHDDIWFWGTEKACVKGWGAMTEFSQLMGLEFNIEKTGSVKIAKRPGENSRRLPSSLPKGNVAWGFLKLDSTTGRLLVDQQNIDVHVEELRRQLEACKSIFDWIQAWNVYGARFFANNSGRPANSFGKAHVDMLLEVFARIQAKLFASTGGSVTSTLKSMLRDRFGVEDIPDGCLYFPATMGGLDLQNPFVKLYLIRNSVPQDPNSFMDKYVENEEANYRSLRSLYDQDSRGGTSHLSREIMDEFSGQPFMSFQEYTRYSEQNSIELGTAYKRLIEEPKEYNVLQTSDVAALIDSEAWARLTSYQRWIIQLYSPDMIARFGSLNIVDKGLLPTGMVGMFRESRFKWQG